MTVIKVATYLAAIVAANLLVVRFGPGITIFNAFLFIGLDFTLRDGLHETWRGRNLILRMGALIAAGSLISWFLNRDAGRIGLASLIAFGVSQTADAAVYHKTGSVTKSNTVGAILDSILFPTIAFGGLLIWVTIGQFAAKVIGGEVWRVALRSKVPKVSARIGESGDTSDPI